MFQITPVSFIFLVSRSVRDGYLLKPVRLLLAVFLVAVSSGEAWAGKKPAIDRPVPPPMPRVTPMIGAQYPSDSDRDRLNDRLSTKAAEALERAASASASCTHWRGCDRALHRSRPFLARPGPLSTRP